MKATTIQLDKDIVESLKSVREYPRQTYNELIKKMVSVFQSIKKNNQYDEFLHKIRGMGACINPVTWCSPPCSSRTPSR
jgi:hypothetical protein